MRHTICLNTDIGELPGEPGRGLDRAILDVVSRCSIACGGHAGDDESMRATLKAARARNVSAGVHPSYPDKENFGRISIDITEEDLTATLLQQIRRFQNIARDLSVTVDHLKPHGALYNDAAADPRLAEILVSVTLQARIPAVIGPPNSELERAAKANHLRYIAEGFADRRYDKAGRLVSRNMPGAVLVNVDEQIEQVLQLVLKQQVTTNADTKIDLKVETICLHGDTTGAVHSALAIRLALHDHDIKIEAIDT